MEDERCLGGAATSIADGLAGGSGVGDRAVASRAGSDTNGTRHPKNPAASLRRCRGEVRFHRAACVHLAGDVMCRRGSVERLMRRHRIRALAGRRFLPWTTESRHYLPIAPSLLSQRFVANAPNQIWLADITYIATGEGWLYLAATLDLGDPQDRWAGDARPHTHRITACHDDNGHTVRWPPK